MRLNLCAALLLLLSSMPAMAQESNDPATCREGWKDAFRASDYEGAVRFFRTLQAAAKRDDRVAISKMVSYPLRVSGVFRVHNRTAFLRHYDKIFDTKVKHAVRYQVPECIFGNWQGFMAGNGDVWFETDSTSFKVIAVNTESWPKPNSTGKK